jgi:hypothetical protein
MTKIAKLMAQYGMEIPEEILAFRTPYCRVMVRNSDYLTDEDAVRLEARLRLLDCRFLETANPEDRRVDFSRQLYRAFFGLKDYGTTRVRVMREYLERRSEEALQPLLERVRAKTLS